VTEQSTGDAVPERWNAVGPKSDMWMDPAQDPRFAAGAELEGERATLLDYLRAYRLALELKCAGLDAEQLARRSVPPSTMSLLGLKRLELPGGLGPDVAGDLVPPPRLPGEPVAHAYTEEMDPMGYRILRVSHFLRAISRCGASACTGLSRIPLVTPP